MPWANEVFGCPPTSPRKKNCLPIHRPKNSDDLFFSHLLKFLPSFVNFFLNAPLSWMPGAATSFLFIFHHLPLFLTFTYTFFSENSLVGCPGPSHPSHPPLHATANGIPRLSPFTINSETRAYYCSFELLIRWLSFAFICSLIC